MRSSTIKDAAREAARGGTGRPTEQAQVDQLRERLAPVVEHAIGIAREQAVQAAVAAGHARDWATPRVGAAVERGRAAAAPRVEAAAERVVPAVDAARDRIVEELLPRLVEAVHHAVAAGAAAKTAAAESMSRTVEDAALSLAAATPSAKARARRRRRRVRTLWIALAAALVSAGIAAALRKARARQAAWEFAPTEVSASTTAEPGVAGGSTTDIIAAAAGPSDAGVAEPDLGPVAAPSASEPVDLFTPAEDLGKSTSPGTGEDSAAEAVNPLPPAPVEPHDTLPPSGPETVGIETPADDVPARRRGGRS